MFCAKCGSENRDGYKFCPRCGTPVSLKVGAAQDSTTVVDKKSVIPLRMYSIPRYDGRERMFMVFGKQIIITKAQDCYLYYRNYMNSIAYDMSKTMRKLWEQSFFSLDDYWSKYFPLFTFRMGIVYKAVVDLLIKYDIYTISINDLENRMNNPDNGCATYKRFFWVDTCMVKMREQNCMEVDHKYSSKPLVLFDGAFGYFRAQKYNDELNQQAARDMQIASQLYPEQRKTLFDQLSSYISDDIVHDFDVLLSVFFQTLYDSGVPLYELTSDNISKCNSIVQNLSFQEVENNRVGDLLKHVFENSLDTSNVLEWVKKVCPDSLEIGELLTYMRTVGRVNYNNEEV